MHKVRCPACKRYLLEVGYVEGMTLRIPCQSGCKQLVVVEGKRIRVEPREDTRLTDRKDPV